MKYFSVEALSSVGRGSEHFCILRCDSFFNRIIFTDMSKMLAEIRRIVDEDISNRVSQFDVIFEAITNAIHANATNIECVLYSADNNPIEINGQDVVRRKVNAIKIADNGDGLNDPNYDSFCKYRSEFKKSLGCKGVGRFVLLKVYEYVLYRSLLVTEKEERTFKFHPDFETNDLEQIKNEKIEENYTEVVLNTLTRSYFDDRRNVDRRIDLDLDAVRERVLVNLVPTLFFYKKNATDIYIKFIDGDSGESATIGPADIPNFLEKAFQIQDRYGNSFQFALNFFLENEPGKLSAFYCANNRTVCEFFEKDLKLSLPNGYSGFFLLESPYLDPKVNHERNDFTIYPVRTDQFSSLSWELINDELKRQFAEIVTSVVPAAKQLNRMKIQQIYEDRPYLINYLDESDIDIAGFVDKGQIIEKAKKRFDNAKEKVLAAAGKSEYTDADLSEAIELAQNELVSYINDRVQILDRLRKLVDKKERVESVIHNLFMEKQTDDDYFSVGKNNLWLLDDRFTSYSYAASDRRIKEVLTEIGEEVGDVEILNDRPDLSLFFSHNPNNPNRLKSVLVEIKPFDFQSKSDRKKFAGVQQLVDYVEAFKIKENIEEIFAFLITDIDEKLSARLRRDDYTPLFSLDQPMFHRFYKELGMSIYVISAGTLIKDAEARSRVFLDIIRKQSRLNDILKDQSEFV